MATLKLVLPGRNLRKMEFITNGAEFFPLWLTKRILFNTWTSKVNNVIKKSWSLDNHDTVNEGDNDSKKNLVMIVVLDLREIL